MTARALIDESRAALTRQKLRDLQVTPAPSPGDDSDRATLDAVVDDGHRFMRQLYAVAGDIGVRDDDGRADHARAADEARLRRSGRPRSASATRRPTAPRR